METYPELSHKEVLVIGGSGGIGRACVSLFARSGAEVTCTFNKSRKAGNELGQSLTDKATMWQLDVASEDSCAALARRVGDEIGKLDALVICQGIILGKRLVEYSSEEIRRVFDVNTLGSIRITRDLAPLMSKGSSIVFVSSISESAGSYDAVYAASKGAISAFARSAARQFGPDIRVNSVSPGLTEETGMFRSMKSGVRDAHREATILKRLATPLDIANVIVFLCSSRSRHITGATIDVNGGEYLR